MSGERGGHRYGIRQTLNINLPRSVNKIPAPLNFCKCEMTFYEGASPREVTCARFVVGASVAGSVSATLEGATYAGRGLR